MSLIELIIPSTIFNLLHFWISSKIIKEKIKIKSTKNIIVFIALTILVAVVNFYFKNFLKGAINFLFIFISYYFIYDKSINKIFGLTFTTFILFFLSEIIYSLVLLIFINVFPKLNNYYQSLIVVSLANIIIGGISLLIYKIKMIEKLFSKIIKNQAITKFLGIAITAVFSMFILANKNFLLIESSPQYILNFFLIILFCCIIYFLLREKNENNVLSLKYEQLFNYLEDYEKELNKKSIFIHEFRNQIIAIKGFNDGKNKELEKYIQTIVNDNQEGEAKLLKDMENIPKGGLKGLIYYKLGYLNDEGISVTTSVDPKVKKNMFSKMTPKQYKEVIKVIGVLLDNAIESARTSNDKQICLEMYCHKNTLYFILSNTYHDQIDISKIDQVGYSTKGKDRGYGLPLVKKILNDNKYMSLKQEVINNFYIATFTIDFKNIPNTN